MNDFPYKLGKRPATELAPLKWATYSRVRHDSGGWLAWLVRILFGESFRRQSPSGLPSVPSSFGMSNLPAQWGMLENNQLGCCVEAGSLHCVMRWNFSAQGILVPFDNEDAIRLYEKWGGYIPGDSQSDQGTNMVQAAAAWQADGITDDKGVIHKIAAYLSLNSSDVGEIAEAAFLLGAVGIGIQFPEQWMNDFQNGQPWDALLDPQIVGGHYIPVVGRRTNGNFVCVTWGQLQEITPDGLNQACDEGLAYLTQDWIDKTTQRSPNLFDFAQLKTDMANLPVVR